MYILGAIFKLTVRGERFRAGSVCRTPVLHGMGGYVRLRAVSTSWGGVGWGGEKNLGRSRCTFTQARKREVFMAWVQLANSLDDLAKVGTDDLDDEVRFIR